MRPASRFVMLLDIMTCDFPKRFVLVIWFCLYLLNQDLLKLVVLTSYGKRRQRSCFETRTLPATYVASRSRSEAEPLSYDLERAMLRLGSTTISK